MASAVHDGSNISCITGVRCTGFIDYLSFTVPENHGLEMVIWDLFDINFYSFSRKKSGRSGYLTHYSYQGIDVLTGGGTEGMGHNFTLKGAACQRHQERLKEISKLVFSMGGHFSRCDFAIDEQQGLLELDDIQRAVTDGLATTTFSTTRKFNEHNSKTGIFIGRGAYFGSRNSEIFVRIYDKGLEQKLDTHLTRVEIELKGSKANAAMRLAQCQQIGYIVRGILMDCLTFRERTSDSNRSRWPVAKWWELFLGSVEKVKLVSDNKHVADREKRLLWFVSNSATFAEIIEECGPGIIPYMYVEGKQKLKQKGARD